jgi:arginine decarboxylase
MYQQCTPALDAIEQFRHQIDTRSRCPDTASVWASTPERQAFCPGGAFEADVITAKAAVSDAEALFAEAVGAKQAVFVTCGASISITRPA